MYFEYFFNSYFRGKLNIGPPYNGEQGRCTQLQYFFKKNEPGGLYIIKRMLEHNIIVHRDVTDGQKGNLIVLSSSRGPSDSSPCPLFSRTSEIKKYTGTIPPSLRPRARGFLFACGCSASNGCMDPSAPASPRELILKPAAP